MSNWLKLEGDVCAVTGALGGMGVEICREFARNGANVVLLDLDEEKVKAAAADLAAEFGIHAEGYKMNATDEAEVQAAVDATIADFGRVDVLVNTAGILRFAAMEDLPLSDWNEVINVNLTGYFITSQRFGREMIKAGQGRLVHIGSRITFYCQFMSNCLANIICIVFEKHLFFLYLNRWLFRNHLIYHITTYTTILFGSKVSVVSVCKRHTQLICNLKFETI